MSRPGLRTLLLVSLLGFLIARVVHVLRGDHAEVATAHPSVRPAPVPPWAEPIDGACPPDYPVKAKLSSGIYHLPGMSAYQRTAPDRCYRTADDALADGLRAAKR